VVRFKTFSLVLLASLIGGLAGNAWNRTGAWIDEVTFREVADAPTAFAMLEAGQIDLFAHPLTDVNLLACAQANPGVFDMTRAYGVCVEITLNPYGPEFNDGRLNPFSVPAIREALNWLIDREFIANSLYQGLAIPRYTPVTPAFPDYSRYIETFRAIENRYRHDPDRAWAVITGEMQNLGAELVNGVWHYRGKPVEIVGLIRVEDERRKIGDYVADLLEDLGFIVDRRYATYGAAEPCWVFTDPAEGCFHFYTGGWVTTAINRDQGGNFDFFYTPRGLPFPLWQAYTPASEFDEVCNRLARRDFTTLEERAELFARAVELALKDSVRVWVAQELSYFLFRRGLSLGPDLVSGVFSPLWAYTIRWEGRVGGTVDVGMTDLLAEPWNPIAGTDWICDQMPIRGTGNPFLLPDPYTGLYHPQRVEKAEVYVLKGLPVTKTLDWVSLEFVDEITVPADAWVDWDAFAQRFVTVGEKFPEGLTAKAKVVVHYDPAFLEDTWHDGSKCSLADVLMPFILRFDRGKEESAIFDEAVVPDLEAWLEYFRGLRIVSEDPLVIQYYTDSIDLDAELIAAGAVLDAFYYQGPAPWHSIAIGILAEANREAAFSYDKAGKLGIEWMNYVAGPSLPILEKHLRRALSQAYIPYEPTLWRYITGTEARARYQNLLAWYNGKGHFWVGTGPFYLERVDRVTGTITLRRFPEFADPADKWLRFAEPKIAEIDFRGAPEILYIGEGILIPVNITFRGNPYPPEEICSVKWLLFDAGCDLAAMGTAEHCGGPTWHVVLTPEITAKLPTGTARLEVVVSSKVVAVPSIAPLEFVAVP